MKNDALDVVLNKITDEEDWQALLEICDCKANIKLEELTNTGRALAFNKEIRSNYGNSFVNILCKNYGISILRGEYSPDYSDILKVTAAKLEIRNIPDSLTDYDIEVLERNIIAKVLEMVKTKIIKEKGFASWDKLENEAVTNIDELYAEGKITLEEYTKLENVAASSSILEATIAGRVTGFALYVIINQIFLAISRYLGLSIGVVGVGSIIVRTLAVLLGPAGWIFTGMSALWALGDTDWEKTIGTVVFIAIMRQKQKYNINF